MIESPAPAATTEDLVVSAFSLGMFFTRDIIVPQSLDDEPFDTLAAALKYCESIERRDFTPFDTTSEQAAAGEDTAALAADRRIEQGLMIAAAGRVAEWLRGLKQPLC